MQQITKYLGTTTNRLVAVNVVVFILIEAFYRGALTGLELFPWQSQQFGFWQPVTYMFLHGGWMHLGLNMFGLWSFGRVLEQAWGGRRMLIFYLVSGLGAALVHLSVSGGYSIAVGASGALYGILVAFALLFPNFKVALIFLPVPIAAKHFVPVLLLIDLSAGITGVSIFGQNIAHFAHLGGALAGFLLVQYWLRIAPR